MAKKVREQIDPDGIRRAQNRLESWLHAKLEPALLRVEARIRKEKKLPMPHNPAIIIPRSLVLMNLEVWRLRYHVSLDFILLSLFRYYKHVRVTWLPEYGQPLTLGIRPENLCGERSRDILENRIRETYPNGENKKLHAQKIRGAYMNLMPITSRKFESIEDRVQEYTEVASRRQIENFRNRKFKRAWRGNPWK